MYGLVGLLELKVVMFGISFFSLLYVVLIFFGLVVLLE